MSMPSMQEYCHANTELPSEKDWSGYDGEDVGGGEGVVFFWLILS